MDEESRRILPDGYSRGSYSADVELTLILPDGRQLSLAQVGPNIVIFREPMSLPTGNAIVEIRVDDNIRRHNVRILPQSEPSTLVPISLLSE